MIINAEHLILGRFATVAAKKALMGEKVVIVNCEKAMITGAKSRILADYKERKDRGTYKGPFMPRLADRFVRRTIRGMLPYKQPKGKAAYDNISCHIGIPKEYEGKEFAVLKEADVSKLTSQKYISVRDVCRYLGAKQ